jgi:hypothetical protein
MASGGRAVVRLEATGLRFVNGVASSYDDTYPSELSGVLAREDFEAAIRQINDTLLMYWPCNACYVFGYACSVCSLGLSLLCPNMCVESSESNARKAIISINHSRPCKEAGVVWSLKKRCLISWIEIEFPAAPASALGG